MKIGILSTGSHIYSTRRIKEAALERGHQAIVLNTMRFSLGVEQAKPSLYFRGKPLGRYDAVIPRIGASVTFFGTAVVRQFEQMGVFTVAASQAISVSRDKLRSMQIFSRHNIGIPATAFARDRNDVLPAIERVGGAPVIIKVLEGTQGVGVILAETTKVAEAIVETLQSAKQNVLIQKFVAESKGKDIRAFVVGSKVVAAMRRVAQGEEYRSNVHRGGDVEAVTLDERYERTAIQAAQIMGLRVAGVDMLEGNDGPQIMEVNSSPGLEGIERATGVDVAAEIIKCVEEEQAIPDIDIRQRMTLKSGYSVAEIPIGARSELLGVALRDARLRERDIQVLSIHRGGLIIPNPRGERQILLGDTLLCFGKALALRGLMPPPRGSRAKREE